MICRWYINTNKKLKKLRKDLQKTPGISSSYTTYENSFNNRIPFLHVLVDGNSHAFHTSLFLKKIQNSNLSHKCESAHGYKSESTQGYKSEIPHGYKSESPQRYKTIYIYS